MTQQNHPNQPWAKRVSSIADTTVREALAHASKPGVISLSGGIPHPNLFPTDEVRDIVANFSAATLQRALQYSPTPGIPELRALIAERYSAEWDKEIKPNQVLITTGSQQALDLLGKAYIDPGDTVLLERPTYLATILAWNAYLPIYEEIMIHPDGVNINELKKKIEESRPKLLYTAPTFQNPTGFTWSQKKRAEAVAILANSPCILVEDDPYGKIYFDTKPPRAMTADTIDHGGIYLGTFSKTLCPGLRIGFVIAHEDTIETLTLIKQSMDLHSPTLSQLITLELLRDEKKYQDRLVNMREYYGKQAGIMQTLLKEHLSGCSWSKPNGGLFFWVTVPTDSRGLLEKAIANNVAFMPGYAFYAKNPDYTTIRVTFATATPSEMKTALKNLGELIQSSK